MNTEKEILPSKVFMLLFFCNQPYDNHDNIAPSISMAERVNEFLVLMY